MDSFVSLILSLLLIIPLIYWYLTLNHNYWSERGIKGPKPIPVFGNLLDIFIRPQPVTEEKWLNEYGKIYGYFVGNTPILSVAEPELIKTLLVKDFHIFPDRRKQKNLHLFVDKNLLVLKGRDWKRVRSIVSPTFSSGKMKKMYPMVKQCLNDFLDALDIYAKNGKDMNVKEMFGNYTMDVIATCAFASKINVYGDKESPFLLNVKKMINIKLVNLFLLMVLPNYLAKFFRAIQSAQFFKQTTRHIMQNRRKSDKKYNDFIQLLMDAEKDKESIHDVNEAHHVNEGADEIAVEKKALNINMNTMNKQLSEDEIFGQTVTFFFAGYETTGTTLSMASYELALNARVQERLYNEVNSAIDSKGDISYEELAKLEYLDAVLSETLRLHSPSIALQRIASTDYELDGTGIKVREGQEINIPVYAMHRSEEFYEQALEFRPERFLPENRHQIKPYTYLPFGAGPRNCIGMRFALLEAKLCLAHIIKRFRFFRSSQTEFPLRYKRAFRLLSTENIFIGIEKRV